VWGEAGGRENMSKERDRIREDKDKRISLLRLNSVRGGEQNQRSGRIGKGRDMATRREGSV